MSEPLDLQQAEVPELVPQLERFSIFRLGGELFVIFGAHSKGLARVEQWTRIPGAPPYLLGAAYLRGDVLPVLDLSHPLELSAPLGAIELALVVEAGGMQVACAVDEVVGFDALDINTLEPLGNRTPERWKTYGQGLLRSADGVGLVLDLEKLLGVLRLR